MHNYLFRFIGVFVALLGLAYLGHHVVQQGKQAAPAPAAAPVAATPVPAASGAGGSQQAYAVYPDSATEKLLGLGYQTFHGDFVRGVTVTPLPPHTAGTTTLRIAAQPASKVDIVLNDPKCAAPVQVVVSRIDDKGAIEKRDLDAGTSKLSLPFPDGKVPQLLIEMRMGDKAANNYFCGVNVSWAD